MTQTAGWTIWGKTEDRVRQFQVAKVLETEALALLRSEHPEVQITHRKPEGPQVIRSFMKMRDGQVIEARGIDPKDAVRQRGVAIDKLIA